MYKKLLIPQLFSKVGLPYKVRDHHHLLPALEVSEEEESTVAENLWESDPVQGSVWNPVLRAAAQGCLTALRELSKVLKVSAGQCSGCALCSVSSSGFPLCISSDQPC